MNESAALLGQMMHRPLLLSSLCDYFCDVNGEQRLVTQRPDRSIHSLSYAEAGARIRRLANALVRLGVRPGDRVATLAWNDHRHFELYYAIAGIGAVCHTVNPRMAPDTIRAIAAHADDSIVFHDPQFADIAKSLGIATVALDEGYEALLAAEPDSIDWPSFSEEAASGLCYTSGTTGAPKGVLYSHRSTMLATLSCLVSFSRILPAGRATLAAVPLFHVNAWGLAFMLPLVGGSLALPGPCLDGASLFDFMDRADVHGAWGAPTVWTGLLAEMRARGRRPASLASIVMGGSAAPPALIAAYESEFGVEILHGWGMTEMSPIGAINLPSPSEARLPAAERRALQQSQGRRAFGVEMKLADDAGQRLPHDGIARGHLLVRGASVASGYFRDEAAAGPFDRDGWFATGDVATIGPTGLLTIVDRSKDMVKSGGEWISPAEIERAAHLLPGIAQCAVIGVAHPKWGERPVLIAVADAPLTAAEVLAHLFSHLPRWQVPDTVVFIDAMPVTATGKISKLLLRERFSVQELGLRDDAPRP